MEGNNPLIVSINEPSPAPLLVWLSVIEGFGMVLQQIPLATMAEPPSDNTLPPPIAKVSAIVVSVFVTTIGRPSGLFNGELISF